MHPNPSQPNKPNLNPPPNSTATTNQPHYSAGHPTDGFMSTSSGFVNQTGKHQFGNHRSYNVNGNANGNAGGGQNRGTCGKNGRKLKIGFAVIVVLCIVAGVVIGVVIGTRKSSQPITPDDNDVIQYSCVDNPSCEGVRPNVQDYVISRYRDKNEIEALLQVSRSYESVFELNTTKNSQEIVTNLFTDLQCMDYVFGGQHQKHLYGLESLYLDSDESLQTYLNMIQQSSGQVLAKLPADQLASSCSFNITLTPPSQPSPSGRLLQLQQEDPTCPNLTTTLIFIPGVAYTVNGALESVKLIENALKVRPQVQIDNGVKFMASRKGGQAFTDVILAYKQKKRQLGQTQPSLKTLLKFVMIMLNPPAYNSFILTTFSAQILELFNDFYRFCQQSLFKYASNPLNHVIQTHTRMIKQQILQGRKVIIVAHSQGTLYANNIYSQLSAQEQKYVKMVFLAAAASVVGDQSSRYITHQGDKVINGIRVMSEVMVGSLMNPLVANKPSTDFLNDPSDHLVIGYLLAFMDDFRQLVIEAKDSAQIPQALFGTGDITIELTWDQKPDVDLHVFEPNGKHVYYYSPEGNVGYLDVDDGSSYGPQHYYTFCNKIESGTYKVSLNYYRGSGPSKTSVNIKAGTKFLTKLLTLPQAIGSAGNSNPPHFVCNITAAYNQRTRSFSYDISTV